MARPLLKPHFPDDAWRAMACADGRSDLFWLSDPATEADRRTSRGYQEDIAAQAPPPVRRAQAVHLHDDVTGDAALRLIVANCLDHIVPNAHAIASRTYDDEHVHQLRVGLRRLRSALRFFDGWTDSIDPQWQVALAGIFRALGIARDADVLTSSIVPLLREAGAPDFALPAIAPPNVTTLVQQSDFRHTLRALIDLVSDAPPASTHRHDPAAAASSTGEATGDGVSPDLATVAAHRLNRWHNKLRRHAKHFDTLEAGQRHTLRKRLKRLRYAVEFIGSLYRHKTVAAYVKHLESAQDSLGRYNDFAVAIAVCRDAAADDARAWFAVGWLKAQQDMLVPRCTQALKPFVRARPFWIAG